MDILSKVPERLKELMFERELTTKKLAEELGVKSNTITRYLKGTSSPNFQIFVKMLEYFECSADFMLGLEEFSQKNAKPVLLFSESFRKAMKECKFSQYALQKKTDISWNNLHKWLKGERLPYPDSLLKIAKAMDCRVDLLLGR